MTNEYNPNKRSTSGPRTLKGPAVTFFFFFGGDGEDDDEEDDEDDEDVDDDEDGDGWGDAGTTRTY